MIYRIAIYKYGKFDHYATPGEMETLRVNGNGEVEALDAAIYKSDFANKDGIPFKIGEWAAEDDYYHGIIMGQWTNVSDTHKVEWGVIDYQDDPQHNKLYEGDIIKDGNKNSVIDDIESAIYWIKECTICPSDVIGNIHQNPELLEGK